MLGLGKRVLISRP